MSLLITLSTAKKMAEDVKNKMKSSKSNIIEFNNNIPISYKSETGIKDGKILQADLLNKTFKVSYPDNNDWQTPISINMNNLSIEKNKYTQDGGGKEENSLEFELNTDFELN